MKRKKPTLSDLAREVEENLPKKASDPSIPPYQPPKHKVLGNWHRIELDYRVTEFEQPPRDFEFSYAFKKFYDLMTGRENPVRREEVQPMDIQMIIPRANPKIVVGLDTHKQYMYFRYREGDKESEKIVNDFIKRLME